MLKKADKLLEALENNLTVMISLVVKLKKSQAKKPKRKVVYLKLVKGMDIEADKE